MLRLIFSWQALLEYRVQMDWKVIAAAPLVIENQLPIMGTYLIWETPKMVATWWAGSEPQEILLHRDIDMEAWQMQDKQQDPGAAVAQGSSLVVRMFVPLWLVYATNLPIGVVKTEHMTAFKQQNRAQFFGLCLITGESS
ncbi:hypothetical protein WJX79_007519 [Trebouxia sp. C0005]